MIGFIAVAVVVDRDFFTTGDYLPLSWGDWMGQAYRVRFFQEYGFATWDHNWAGGLSLFQTYQFVPHALTAAVAEIGDASVGRSMLVIEGLLITWVRVSGYVSARALGLRPAAALLAGVVTFGLNDYASEILSFAALWGLALVPVLLVAAVRYSERPAIYLVAVAAGLGVYVHPHVALAGVALLCAAFFAKPPNARRLARLAGQGVLVGLAAAFFWVPALFSAKPPMQDPASADVMFLRLIFDGGVEHFADVVWLLVPLTAVATAIFWRSVRHGLLRYVGVFLGITLFFIAISYAGVGPERVRLMQSVRLLSVLPLGLGLWTALAADAAMRHSSRWPRWRLASSSTVVLVAIVLAVPLIQFAADQPYRPAWRQPDQVSDWLAENRGETTGRVWFDDLGTALYTYEHFDQVRATMSHFPVGDWSLLARPVLEGINLPEVEPATTEDYLKAMAVSHLVFSGSRPFEAKITGGETTPMYSEVARLASPRVVIYETPWVPVDAFLTAINELPDIDIPNTRYAEPEDRALRDELVREYSNLAYSEQVVPVALEYPSATAIQIELEGLRKGQYLVVAENWDRSWRARASGGGTLPVERYGPNYIGVDVSGLEGDIAIELRHTMSLEWKIGIALTALSVPLATGLMLWERRRTGAISSDA